MTIFSQGTDTWKKVLEDRQITITAYDRFPFATIIESELVEPGLAVNLSGADRARMNTARPGIQTPPEQL